MSAVLPVVFAERPTTLSPADWRNFASLTALAAMVVANRLAEVVTSPVCAAVCNTAPENASVAPRMILGPRQVPVASLPSSTLAETACILAKVIALSNPELSLPFPPLLCPKRAIPFAVGAGDVATSPVIGRTVTIDSPEDCLNFAFETALAAMVAAKLPVPEPVTSPVSVIVWSPVLVPLEVPENVPLLGGQGAEAERGALGAGVGVDR